MTGVGAGASASTTTSAPHALSSIVVCVDGSEPAERAFDEAIRYRSANQQLIVVTAFAHQDPVSLFPGMRDVAETENRENRARAEQVVAKYRAVCEEKKIPATIYVVGAPNVKDALCDKIEELAPDLVFVGHRGLGAVKRLVFGSVSNYVVHHVSQNVVIVK